MSTSRRTFTRHRTLIGATTGLVAGLGLGLGLSVAGSPPASASPLPLFGGCEELRQWYVDRALPLVGPYGLGGGVVAYGGAMEDAGSGAPGEPGAPVPVAGQARVTQEDGQTASGTGTNVQESDVDEPDLAKTDGSLVVRLVGGRLLVSRVGDGQVGRVGDAGTLELPAGLQASELLLSGTRVLVVGSSYLGGGPAPQPLSVPDGPTSVEPPVARALPFAPYPLEDSSRLVEVDLTDPASPRVLSDRTYGGRLVSARQYDGAGGPVVRLVLHTGTPTLDFVQPDRDRSESEATAENRRIVRASRLDDWLPQVRDSDRPSSDADEPLLRCGDVRHPRTASREDLGTLSVVTLPFSDPTSTSATAVTTGAQTVYSSTDRLYLALGDGTGSTQVHAFALEGDRTRYVASGSVEGTVRDRWSMDEHDGVLRLAVGYGGWQASDSRDNGVVTLREDGAALEVLGTVRGLGPDEEIKSVRWFDDLAVVVTFRQTDPLYTVDLSVPANPRTLGALKIPGFSTYLHPLGDGRLLGLGQDADAAGTTLGAQASVFDVSDLRDPRRLSQVSLAGSYLYAENDPRALTWLPGPSTGGTVLAGAAGETDGRPSVVELVVGPGGSLARGRTWALDASYGGGVAPRALPLGDGRVALVGVGVTVVRVS